MGTERSELILTEKIDALGRLQDHIDALEGTIRPDVGDVRAIFDMELVTKADSDRYIGWFEALEDKPQNELDIFDKVAKKLWEEDIDAEKQYSLEQKAGVLVEIDKILATYPGVNIDTILAKASEHSEIPKADIEDWFNTVKGKDAEELSIVDRQIHELGRELSRKKPPFGKPIVAQYVMPKMSDEEQQIIIVVKDAIAESSWPLNISAVSQRVEMAGLRSKMATQGLFSIVVRKSDDGKKLTPFEDALLKLRNELKVGGTNRQLPGSTMARERELIKIIEAYIAEFDEDGLDLSMKDIKDIVEFETNNYLPDRDANVKIFVNKDGEVRGVKAYAIYNKLREISNGKKTLTKFERELARLIPHLSSNNKRVFDKNIVRYILRRLGDHLQNVSKTHATAIVARELNRQYPSMDVNASTIQKFLIEPTKKAKGEVVRPEIIKSAEFRHWVNRLNEENRRFREGHKVKSRASRNSQRYK